MYNKNTKYHYYRHENKNTISLHPNHYLRKKEEGLKFKRLKSPYLTTIGTLFENNTSVCINNTDIEKRNLKRWKFKKKKKKRKRKKLGVNCQLLRKQHRHQVVKS